MGLLFKRHSTERGSVHSFYDHAGVFTKVRFFSKGGGRHKRFYVTTL